MGNGSPIDSAAIDESVEQMRKQLDNGVVNVQFRYQKGQPFKQRDGKDHRAARVTVTPGIHEQGGYFDMQWWANGDYKYHYREEGLEFRFGREVMNETTNKPVRHFHPPSNLDKHRQSCIGIEQPPSLVTIAVLKTWWTAVENGDETLVNAQDGLP
ncbi:hypothetical protein HWV23_15425 [Natronomonas halophila]|uniref:hypothetical protein n=1 Tax=Natronomonas halophila TaxID=2747817 RepID=UPI0015B74D24|nr:hypothetical protein [Natronomonas halophila]QLD87054.1 hypothetical protein HWV23_15425 [Natronomonas halophila]